ncbi:hypothetical protein BH10ACT9_BH10ACT9_35320 [soil metagenome]
MSIWAYTVAMMPTTATTTPTAWSQGRSTSGATAPRSCSTGAATAITNAATKPIPASHSSEPIRPLMP